MDMVRADRVPSLLRRAIFAGALMLLAPAAFAQPPAEDGFKGQGAALCLAAGELLGGRPGADAGVPEGLRGWRQVLYVMEGTEDRRRVAVDTARAALVRTGDRAGTIMAQSIWSTCAKRDFQVRYLVAHAPEERLFYHLAEEPGTVLEPAVARRLNRSARCLAAAELFSQPRPSRALRAAFRLASPPHPGAAALQAIQERSIAEIDAAPGYALGKELVAGVVRYILNPTPEKEETQRAVADRASLILQTCQPAIGSRQPAP